MWKLNNKPILYLKGFSIIELLITMLISTIVISLSYYAYENMTYHFNKYQRTKEKLQDLEFVYSDFYTHFQKSKSIAIIDNRIIFFTNNMVEFEISPTYILNRSILSDSIEVDIIVMEAKYNAKKVEKGIIDELSIKTLLQGDTMNMLFYKKYLLSEKLEVENPSYFDNCLLININVAH